MKRKEQHIYSLTNLESGNTLYFPTLVSISKHFGKSRSWAYAVLVNNGGYWKNYLIRKEEMKHDND